MAISFGGDMLAAFLPDKVIQRYYSNALQKNVDNQADVLSSRQGDNTADLRRFSQGTRTAVADLDARTEMRESRKRGGLAREKSQTGDVLISGSA